jgi:mRNA-degrading endonuclease RelE of RelBE toxin-antitoxin system
MKSSTKKSFRSRFQSLPPEIRQLARKNFQLWLRNPHHPSIHFKKVGNYWSARIGDNYRALAIVSGERLEWFWIGSHDEYEFIIRRR